MQCVDRGLESFGSHAKQTIYWRITILHNSLHSCVVEHPELFSDILHQLFGDTGYVAEAAIIRELRKTFDLKGMDIQTLAEALVHAREQIAPDAAYPIVS